MKPLVMSRHYYMFRRPSPGHARNTRLCLQYMSVHEDICEMLVKRQRRWAEVVQMLYKCFVFAGYLGINPLTTGVEYIWVCIFN